MKCWKNISPLILEEIFVPIEMKDSDNALEVIFTGSRMVTEKEYLKSYKKHLSQDRDQFQKIRISLNDWSEVTDVEVCSTAILQIAALCKDSATINP